MIFVNYFDNYLSENCSSILMYLTVTNGTPVPGRHEFLHPVSHEIQKQEKQICKYYNLLLLILLLHTGHLF